MFTPVSIIWMTVLPLLMLFWLNTFVDPYLQIDRGLSIIVVNNTERHIDLLLFGSREYEDMLRFGRWDLRIDEALALSNNITIFDIDAGGIGRGNGQFRITGIGMFYRDDEGIGSLIPVGYKGGSICQRYLLIVEINEIDDEGVITDYEVFNRTTIPSGRLIPMFLELSRNN